MALPRQLIVRPIGLVTQPNKLGVFPPGACAQAKDMICRAAGTVQQAYTKTASWSSTLTGDRPRLLHSTAGRLIVLFRNGSGVWGVEWWTPNLTAPPFTAGTLPYTTDDFSQTGRLQAITVRGRTIINGGTKDNIVADYESPSSAAERTFRLAGLPQPDITLSVPASANPQAVNPDTAVTYCAVIKKVFTDGYFLRSRPSLFKRYGAGVSTLDAQIQVQWEIGALAAGDIVEVYRSQAISAVSEVTSTTLYRVASVVLSSSEAAAASISVLDTAVASDVGGPLNGLGEELYSNPNFGNQSTLAEDPPPLAACVSSFRGRAFYANCRYPASIKLSMRNGIGALSATDKARANGIGSRSITATWSNGNATVSSVSASHMLGISPGQKVVGTGFSASSRVNTVGATSFTVTVAPSAGAAGGSLSVFDLIEIDGVEYTTFVLSTGDGLGTSYRRTSVQALSTSFFNSLDVQIQKNRYVPPATLSLRATRGDTYDPKLPLMSQSPLVIQPTQLKNQIRWSLPQRPEGVPPANEDNVGVGELYAQVPTRDAQWYFCSDGLQRLSGTITPIDGVPDIQVDEIDSTLILAGPRAWCVLRDRIFAYTNRGLVEISNAGIKELTTGRIGDLLPGALWAEAETPLLVADERVDEIYIIGAHATLNFVYSARYDCFTTTSQFDGAQTGVQIATSLALVFGYATNIVDELQPDLTALLSAGPIMDLQPVFGDRPDTIKQFIDTTYIFETGSSGTLDPRWNGGVFTGTNNEDLVACENDMRATVGVPRNAPALAYGFAPGYAINSAGLKKLAGISLRYAAFTEQAGRR